MNKITEKMEENIYVNPHQDIIIGVVEDNIYLKSEYLDYVVVTTEQEYFKILKEYVKTKRDFCQRYNHFCGAFGNFYAEKYERLKDDFKLNEPFDVEDNGNNDGMEIREITYPIYLIHKFDKHCDMEHG